MTTLAQSSLAALPVSPTPRVKANANSVQLVTCQCAGQGFALRTDALSGVHQLSREQAQQGVDRLETAQGVFPIISLADLLADQLNVPLVADPAERSLLAIQYQDQKFALRTGSVSRPVMASAESFTALPHVAHPSDASGIFSDIVVTQPDSDRPADALRLVFDPAVALGLKATSTRAVPAAAELRRPAAESLTQSTASQVLAFMPEDSTHTANYIFALPLSVVAEVTTAHEVMPVEISSDVLEGYIYWRKRPVPVIRLGHSFGIAGSSTASGSRLGRRLVVARTGGDRWVAFYTQLQMQSIKIPNAEAMELPAVNGRPSLGAFKTEMGMLVVPDLAKILDA